VAKANRTWKVLPHRSIEKLEQRLWRVEGDLQGMPLKRVMTLAKQADGSLVVHNGVPLDASSMAEIDAWGPVSVILVPNGYHRLDAKVWKDRYPEARVLCPAGARSKVAEVVGVDGSYADLGEDPHVALETLEGTGEAEGAMIVRDGDRVSVVLNDAVSNMPHLSGAQGWVLRNVTGSTGGPRVTRVARWFILKDRRAFQSHLHRLADLPGLARIIVSHHETIDVDAAQVLRDVAATL
jgi:hypothetical protein